MPIIKERVGKINSMYNYRSIDLASTLSKVIDRILLIGTFCPDL